MGVLVRQRREVAALAVGLALGCGAIACGGERPGGLPASTAATRTPGHRLATLPAAAQATISAAVGAQAHAFRARSTAEGYRLEGAGVTADLTSRRVTLGGALSVSTESLGRGDR